MFLHFTSAILPLIGLAAASMVKVNNYCHEPHWITVMNGTFFVQGNGTWKLDPGVAFITPIEGKGNTLGITATPNFWTTATPKLILGYTTDRGELWWSIYGQDDDGGKSRAFPAGHFRVRSPRSEGAGGDDVCGTAAGYEAVNHNCTDAGVVLTVDFC